MTRDELKQLAQNALDGKHGEITFCERELARGVLELCATLSKARAKNRYEHSDITGE